MERLRHDDPPRLGPYLTLARLDADSADGAVPERRYLARTADGERTVLLCAPLPEAAAAPAAWAMEAELASRLSVPRFLRPASQGSEAGLPWYAVPYTPVLPLPAALAAHGGPLPEDLVRRLGAALAAGLAAAHARGQAHAGVSPAAVLIGAAGPLLGCFGAVRSAAPEGPPGLDPGCLAPELRSGGRPEPLGDVFALGGVLAYAASGHTVPEQSELPPGLRQLVASCLARDPADRPSAPQVLHALSTTGPARTPAPAAAPAATVLDEQAPPPLPGRVVAALAAQSAGLLASELPAARPARPAPQKVH
ncbi:Serine/threonine-protein kinase AfsK [Streptomyces sp. ADI95-16]|uniref:serine/threonine protein kinase n=1 Tax=Streptomyces sp. ADI95-16 TaxID=1522758 RepID=UPI000F3A9C50|nr:serine/threonine protein kinase [Streptomyces sp. ADI95-16]AYV30425.1 Serine/threonine-protein kinase AfsK [Streptomyces sp. ADI95-16]